MHKVLGRLLEHDLYVKAEKCVFSKRAVSFLGYRISTSGVVMECDRVNTVCNWPTPTTVKEVQWFLGFANYYRRFIRGVGQWQLLLSPCRRRAGACTVARRGGRSFQSVEGAVY